MHVLQESSKYNLWKGCFSIQKGSIDPIVPHFHKVNLFDRILTESTPSRFIRSNQSISVHLHLPLNSNLYFTQNNTCNQKSIVTKHPAAENEPHIETLMYRMYIFFYFQWRHNLQLYFFSGVCMCIYNIDLTNSHEYWNL